MTRGSPDSEYRFINSHDFPEKPFEKTLRAENPNPFSDLQRRESFLNLNPAMARQASDIGVRALFPNLPILFGESMEDFMIRAIRYLQEAHEAEGTATDIARVGVVHRSYVLPILPDGTIAWDAGIRGQDDKDLGRKFPEPKVKTEIPDKKFIRDY